MKELINLIREFNEVRNWRRFHDPRSLALALCGEVGELAQLFRWRTSVGRKLSASKRKDIEIEVADIFIFLLALCVELEIDPDSIIRKRLQENEKRFPDKHGVRNE
jgi:NTP pyrophosphatase (non-canonical NTP hydrolase)